MTRRIPGLAVVLVVAGLSTGQALAAAPPPNATSLQPDGWDAALRLPEPADKNPDPHVIEIDITARVADVEVAPNERVKIWG